MTADFAPEGTLMTLVQFKYVLEIAKTGSVNQAANNLFVSQSVVSNALKTLEKELGQLIFYRMTTGMQLTPFGENFVAYIKPIQMHLDQLNRLLQTGCRCAHGKDLRGVHRFLRNERRIFGSHEKNGRPAGAV